MKDRTYQAIIIGLFITLGIVMRPGITNALSLSVVGWGEEDSITTDMIVDGNVTTEKIANNASESNRIQEWNVDTTFSISTPGGATGSTTLDPSISVIVPSGKAYYYMIKYAGYLWLDYGDRNGSLSQFRADLRITPLSDTTPIGATTHATLTGMRGSWSAMGDNTYWASPYSTVWMVRLAEGTHDIKFKLDLGVDGTMTEGQVSYHRAQVLRIL